jgi:hypothetical protein
VAKPFTSTQLQDAIAAAASPPASLQKSASGDAVR